MARDSLYPASVKVGKPVLCDLPNGWQRISLKKCLNVEARKADIQDDQEYDLVTVKRSRGGVVRREHLKGREISVKSQFFIYEGDFLISKRQIVHGACGLVPKELSGSIVSNEYSVFTSKPDFYLPYMEYLSESLYFQQTCFHSSIGVHIEKMIFKLDGWFKWPFNVPPLLEQKRITQILSAWDKAIATTEKLLTNSREQKGALMQQLLTGKKRLLDRNGVRFKGKWRTSSLKKISEFIKDGTHGTHERYEDGIPMLSATNITKDGKIDFNDAPLISIEDYKKIHSKYRISKGDVLLTVVGTLGRVAIVETDTTFTLQRSVAIIRLGNDISIEFIKQIFSSPHFTSILMRRSNSTAQAGVYLGELGKIHISIPEIEEQKKIACVLSASNQEILALQDKLAALKNEKKALMQQLLTGKRRVKEIMNGN